MYRLLYDDGQPEILLAAASDKQAGRLFESVVLFIRQSPALAAQVHLREYIGQIVRRDGGGKIIRMASKPETAHGYNPNLVICDELAQWGAPNHRKMWAALTTGGGARSAPQVFVITTPAEASEREDGILGRMIDGAAARGTVETAGTLRIIRHTGSRLLAYVYEADTSADPAQLRDAAANHATACRDHGADSDEARDKLALLEEWRTTVGNAAKSANPASWITTDYLLTQAENPELTAAEFLQLHAGIWVDSDEVFIPEATWDPLTDPATATTGRACLGIDGSRNHDTTALAWSIVDTDDIHNVGVHVFSARRDAPHHTFCPGGEINYQLVEDTIEKRFGDLDVYAAGYDPRYLLRSVQVLEDRLPDAKIVAVEPVSRHMRDALACLHRVIHDGRLRHNGCNVLAAHIAATKAEQDERGWVVRKRKHSRPIDAVIALAIAVWMAEEHIANRRVEPWAMTW